MDDRVNPSTQTLASIFEEWCPFYMSMGMSYEEYWRGSPELARYYRKAFSLKQKREFDEINTAAWLNGFYIDNAVFDAVAHILGDKKSTEDIKYFNSPIDWDKQAEKAREDEVERERKKAAEWMMQLYNMTNQKFTKK